MHNRISLVGALALAGGVACAPPINTVPAPVAPETAVQHYDLELPPNLEVRSVSFSATTFAEVSGTPNAGTSSAVGGRAFVQVYAVHRTTGEQYLLLYEDVANRKQPVQVIRFVPPG